MLRRLLWMSALALVCAAPAMAETRTYFGFSIGVSNAPPPPRVVFQSQPDIVVVPGSTVYVVEDPECDYDMFRYGGFWFVYDDGYWYRARAYRGPFTVVDVRYVPRQVLTLPPPRWKHHPHGGPPGQMKKRDVVVVREHGRGHGKWKDDD